MNKARETILRLVAEGKITVEEAEELLDAVEGGSKNLFNDIFAAKRAAAQDRARARATRPERDRGHDFMGDFKFNFPWDDPDWKWPWEQPGWRWPWEKPGAAKPVSELDVPEGAQLKIKNGGGDLVIRGTAEDSPLRLIGVNAASKVSAEDENKEIHISSAGADLVIEVPAKVVSMETLQSGGDISIDNLRADLVTRVIGGDISVSGAAGKIQVSSEGGDIWLASIRSTAVEVHANGGDISLNMLPAVKEGSFSLSADGGEITLILPPDSQCQIAANAPGGSINHDLPQGTEIIKETDNYLNAKLNGGGAEFVLYARSDDITIKA